MSKPCSWHKPSKLGYIEADADAQRRIKRGEEQKQCPECKRWFWKHELGVKPS